MQISKFTLMLALYMIFGAFLPKGQTQATEFDPNGTGCNLPAPDNVQLDFVTPSSAQLSWSPVAGASGYATELLDVSENNTYHISTSGTSILYNNAYIKPGHDYEFRVAPECPGGGYGAFSEKVNFHAPVVVIIDIVFRNGVPEMLNGSGQFFFPPNTPTDGTCQYNFDIVHTNEEGKESRYEFLSYPHPDNQDLAIEHHLIDGMETTFGPNNAQASGPILYVNDAERQEEGLIATISTIIVGNLQPAVDIHIINPDQTDLFMVYHCEEEGKNRSAQQQSVSGAGTTAPPPAAPAQQPETDAIKAWPNPAQEQIFLEFSVAQDAHFSLQLFDQLGRLQGSNAAGTQTLSAGKHLIQYPLASLPAGMYLLHIRVGDSTRTLKIIKE